MSKAKKIYIGISVLMFLTLFSISCIYFLQHYQIKILPKNVEVEKKFAQSAQALSAQLNLTLDKFANLPGWDKDNIQESILALHRSCATLIKHKKTITLPSTKNTSQPITITVADWQPICSALHDVHYPDAASARAFYEAWFVPALVSDQGKATGLFTGYYQPSLKGSLYKHAQYQYPIYTKPHDLVRVNLGNFRQRFHGEYLAGRIENGWLKPYYTRAEINRGKIDDKAYVLAWVDNWVDLFFLQIQGSGIIFLDNGEKLQVGYSAQNGWPYTAVGKLLINSGLIPKEKLSLQGIRAWAIEHPKEAFDIFNQNQSYIFFRVLETPGPIGTQKVSLTPKRSLAVDTQYIPLGMPIWLDTVAPDLENPELTKPFQQLLIAQDTGGAIKGVVRGDIFWGPGMDAESSAGHMKNSGRYWILLPKSAVVRSDNNNTNLVAKN